MSPFARIGGEYWVLAFSQEESHFLFIEQFTSAKSGETANIPNNNILYIDDYYNVETFSSSIGIIII